MKKNLKEMQKEAIGKSLDKKKAQKQTESEMSFLNASYCEKCKEIHEGDIKTTLMGFRLFKCESCGRENKLPVSTSLRGVYKFFGVVFILMVFSFLSNLGSGRPVKIYIPGLIPLVGLIGWIMDNYVRRDRSKWGIPVELLESKGETPKKSHLGTIILLIVVFSILLTTLYMGTLMDM